MFKKFICSSLIIIALLSVSVSAIDLPDYDLGLPEGYEWFEFISGEKQKQYLTSGASNSLPSIFYFYTDESGSSFYESKTGPYLDPNYNFPVIHYNKGLSVGNTCDYITLNMFTITQRFNYVSKLFVDFYVAGYGYSQTATLRIKSSSGYRDVVLSPNGTPADHYDELGNYIVVFRFTGVIDVDPGTDNYIYTLMVKPWNGPSHLVDQNSVNTDEYWVQFNTIWYTPRSGYNGNVVQILQGQQDIINGIDQASDVIQDSIQSSSDQISGVIQDSADQIQNSIESGVNDIINMPGVEFQAPEGSEELDSTLSLLDSFMSSFLETDVSWVEVSIPTALTRALSFVGGNILSPIFSSTPLKTLFQCILPIFLLLIAIGSLNGVTSRLSHVGQSASSRPNTNKRL